MLFMWILFSDVLNIYKCSFWRRRGTARFSSSSEPSTEAKVEYIEIHPLYREEKAQFLKNMTIIFRRIGCLRGYIVYGNPTFFEAFAFCFGVYLDVFFCNFFDKNAYAQAV